MMLRSVAACAAAFSVLCATPALTLQDNPMSDVGVLVEVAGQGGIIIKTADCKPPTGTVVRCVAWRTVKKSMVVELGYDL